MQINIHYGGQLSSALDRLIRKKFVALEDDNTHIIGVEVVLRDSQIIALDKVVEVELTLPGISLFTTEIADSFEKAIDQTVELLRKRLSKRKKIRTTHY